MGFKRETQESVRRHTEAAGARARCGSRPRYLHAGVSSCRRLHGPPAPLRLVVGSVVGFGLHLNPQLVGPRV